MVVIIVCTLLVRPSSRCYYCEYTAGGTSSGCYYCVYTAGGAI